jgi:hypothetical protein
MCPCRAKDLVEEIPVTLGKERMGETRQRLGVSCSPEDRIYGNLWIFVNRGETTA